nr:carbamoyltransferase [candidate division Zixibacteria bacterium]
MNVLGISCFYHDSAAALVKDGHLTAAALEERFTGIKHDAAFPINAIHFCLEKGQIDINGLDKVTFYDKPLIKFDRILNGYLQTVPFSYRAFRLAIPVWMREKLWLPIIIKKQLDYRGQVLFVEHHLSHAAGAYFGSPFKQAAILTIDGVGEWATASIGIGEGNRIRLLQAMNYPHSVGLLYSAFTYFLGFRVNSAEYKVMGLAPYGRPKYVDLIKENLVRICDDGSIVLNLKHFRFHSGLEMTGRGFVKLFGRPRRLPEAELTDSDRDIAASIQQVTEEIIYKMASHTRTITGRQNLCLSGGVALNCAAAGKLLSSGLFDDIYIQPASSDSGGAVGAALYISHSLTDRPKTESQPYFGLGPAYFSDQVGTFLNKIRVPYRRLDENDRTRLVAGKLAEGKIVALFNGAMEFGPRALGFRSILADPRDPAVKEKINKAVKFREPFRPFAPVIIEEKAARYFEGAVKSPYMLFNFEVKKEMQSVIPGVTHIDGTARIQTADPLSNPILYRLLEEFEKITGVPVLLNTSLNLRGHPIVRTPEEAFATFISSGIDILLIEDYFLEKERLVLPDFSEFKIVSGHD